MDILVFILTYIPFWATPLLMISAQYAYIYWLKSIRKISFSFIGLGVFCMGNLAFYFWAGGHDGVVQLVGRMAY